LPTSSCVLLFESGDGAHSLAERLLAVDVAAVRVTQVEDALRVLEKRDPLITAVLIPTDFSEHDIKEAIRSLRRAGPASGLMFMAYGRTPDAKTRKRLRSAGVTLALWEPFDDGTLRFQLNRAVTGDRDEHGRTEVRVPTYLLARIKSGGRQKDAIVYSLSVGGAFLETPRASMDGAEIEVELRVPGSPVSCRAQVVFANVPGNLQRPNLPLGMGVRFVDTSNEQKKVLKNYVEHRIQQLDV
jgi:hypothetical protein